MSDAETTTPQGCEPVSVEEMPCVYCGRLVDRELKRCPHCKTSYSPAVRRASREIEGDWFYLEDRNPSNRGVDFNTLIKLIEKGRMRPESIVRGPTTHQDWMYAAETPRLSKHLGCCPHCFAAASPGQEYCDTCHRHLDERPARLRPGVDEPGAADRFPKRAALESRLAEELATHDMARATSGATTAESPEPEAAGVGELVGERTGELARSSRTSRPAGKRPHGRRRAKPHIVVLLTVITIPVLVLVLTSLPLEAVLPGDADRVGSLAGNYRANRLALRGWMFGWLGGDEEDADTDEGAPAPEEVGRQMARIEEAIGADRLEEARRMLSALAARMPEGPRLEDVRARLADVTRRITARRQQHARLLERVDRARRALDGGDLETARSVLEGLTLEERTTLADEGVKLSTLEARIATAELSRRQQRRREQLREEARQMLATARRQADAGRIDEALATYRSIAGKYPADYLPAGTDVAARIAELRHRKAEAEKPEPQVDPNVKRADELWQQVDRLQRDKDYRQALARAREILDLPDEVHPDGLAERVAVLEKKAEEQKKLEFFGIKPD